MGDLAAAPACQDLVRGADADGTSGNSCDAQERPQSVQAPSGCADLAHPRKNERYYPIFMTLAEDPAHRDELACLAWAASSLQAHKAAGMTMADSLRCAFDDPSLPPAQVTVASAEEQACR